MSAPKIVLERPIVFFDLETTGLDMVNDEIIEIGAVRYEADWSEQRYSQLFKPSGGIPIEITELTGITNEMVADMPNFKDRAVEIFNLFDGADLGGYSIGRFDVPFLKKKFQQIGVDWETDSRLVVDARAIYHKREGRHLIDAVRFYCGAEMEGAHRAVVDCEWSKKVIDGQIEKYGLPTPITVADLAAESKEKNPNNVDSEGKLFWKNGEACFAFGKHRSRPLGVVHAIDKGYFDWCLRQDFAPDFMEIMRQARSMRFPKKESAAVPS